MLGPAAPMIASGYLLQTAVDETWRHSWIVLHVSAALLLLAGAGPHLFTHYSIRRALLNQSG